MSDYLITDESLHETETEEVLHWLKSNPGGRLIIRLDTASAKEIPTTLLHYAHTVTCAGVTIKDRKA